MSIKTTLSTVLEKTGIEDITFHDLRHTFNTNMRRAGVDEVITMKMTGHKTLSMYLRYSTVDAEDGKKAVAKFKSFLDREEQITSNSTSVEKKGLCADAQPLDIAGSPGRTPFGFAQGKLTVVGRRRS